VDAEALQRQCLGEAFSERRRGAGMRARELASQRVQTLQRDIVIGELPGRPQTPLEGRPVAFWEVIEHISLLVPHAALDGHRAEHGVDGGPQGLAAVQDDEDALLAVQAALHEV
jgi:hypothetical protein